MARKDDTLGSAAGISKSCCFTGHRVLTEAENNIEARLKVVLERLVNENGVDTFYAGGAIGFDTLAAMCVLHLKGKYPQLKLCLALPCRNQQKNWSSRDRLLYSDILGAADEVCYVSEAYSPACMRLRNDYMLDRSLYCIAFLRRTSGGTYYTVSRAKRLGKELILL